MDEEKLDTLIKLGIFNPSDEADIAEGFYDYEINGRCFYQPDCIYAETLRQEIDVDLRETGEIIDKYWDKGWISDYGSFHRANFDVYKGRYRKAFPTRLQLCQFVFTKSLRRVLNKNKDLKYIIRPLRITPEKMRLHDLHHGVRYGKMPEKPLSESYKYIVYYPSKLMELCIFNKERLVACSIFEVGEFSIVSNTGFWDVNEKSRSLGILTILLEIKYALSRKIRLYYMGLYYKQNPNYQYKTRFRGLELYDWDRTAWLPYAHPRTEELLNQRLPRRLD
jgi:arginyl-tRNA--protein-N-Asp/Glu arginylyltransferase